VQTVEEFYKKWIARTFEQCKEEYKAPQRSQQWLHARKHCVSASVFGAAVGNNSYQTPKDLIQEKLWNTFQGNSFTQYGSYHESDAAATFLICVQQGQPLHVTVQQLYKNHFNILSSQDIFIDFKLHETGLFKSHHEPWIAVSPDGLLEVRGAYGNMVILVEYKCPARARHSELHPYSKHLHNVPNYYMDQMQGILGLFDKCRDLIQYEIEHVEPPRSAFFVVWQPSQVHITLVPYEKYYFTDILFPALKKWFFTQYLPFAFLKETDMLLPNSLYPIQTVVVNEDNCGDDEDNNEDNGGDDNSLKSDDQ